MAKTDITHHIGLTTNEVSVLLEAVKNRLETSDFTLAKDNTKGTGIICNSPSHEALLLGLEKRLIEL